MKKKILVNGTNPKIVKDFIAHSDYYFKCISTTDCWNDLEAHFDIFKPDGYLVFPDSENDPMISQINKLRSEVCYTELKCPVFMCASADICAEINRNNPVLFDLMLKRPVSADNLSLRMLKYFDDMEKKLQDIEQQKLINISEAAAEENRKKHILIVDDDRNILKMLKTVLEEHYEVTTMVNGVLVEKFLASKHVDLIILDYEMPVKTGADVMRDIKSKNQYNDIPVCFLTGVDVREKIMEILALKPDAYMLKPVNMEFLLSTISNLID